MTKYKPVDSLYEDIYDFDEINGKSDVPQRLGKTYNIDECGHIVRPKYRPRITDDRVRLPPVVVGSTLVSQKPTARTGIHNRIEKTSAEHWKRDLEQGKKRETFHGPRLTQKESPYAHLASITPNTHKANPDLVDYTRTVNRPFRRGPGDHDEIYRSFMKDVHDTSMLEKSPQVQEYERRNKIKQEANLSELMLESKYGPSQDYSLGDVFTKRVKEYEESIKATPKSHHEERSFVPKHFQESAYQPAPPTAPRSENDQSSYTRNRRCLQYTSTHLELDVSVHNPPASYHKPRKPAPEVEIDYEHEVQEALRVQRELDLLHQELAEMKKASMINGMQVLRPTTAAAANSNLPGCSTPGLILSAAVLYKSAGPVKAWNGDTAKRGLGFKSKIKREQQAARKLDISLVPDKIRKEMKKYFG